MNMLINPALLSGSVRVPSSKSDAHRAMICAALCDGQSLIHGMTDSDDITATANCLTAMGAKFQKNGDSLKIIGGGYEKTATLDCGESGSTLRFLLPIAGALGINAKVTGRGRLPQRPIDIICNLMRAHGVDVSGDSLPLDISGVLTGGRFTLPGNVSSQYITGLLLALPLIGGGEILLTNEIESVGYIDMTIRTMAAFGVDVARGAHTYTVPPDAKYKPCNYTVEGDWSAAAFLLAAGALGGKVEVLGLCENSLQGDAQIVSILKEFGANIEHNDGIYYARGGNLKGIELDASQIPDMVPVLSTIAAMADGVTKIYGAARLRIKESDRLSAIANALTEFGIKVEEKPDSITIQGGGFKNTPRIINGVMDHRIVMAFAVLAAYAPSETAVSDCFAVNKSYPAFWQDYKKLGGACDVI